jgi:hypothetical protein
MNCGSVDSFQVRPGDHRLDLFIGDLPRRTRPRLITEAFQP